MVRPRLVEEGKPLVDLSPSRPAEDIMMDESIVDDDGGVMEDNEWPQRGVAASSHADSWTHPSSLSSTPSSSLLQAVSRIPEGRCRHHHDTTTTRHQASPSSYRTVIGGAPHGDGVREPTPLSNSHQYATFRHSSAAAPSSLSSAYGIHNAASSPTHCSTPSVRPHQTHYEIGRMEEEDRLGWHDHAMEDHSMEDDSRDVWRARHEDRDSLRPAIAAEPDMRMEGVEDHSIPAPLVVMDGANVAYDYGGAVRVLREGQHDYDDRPPPHSSFRTKGGAATADPKGILVASEYFAQHGIRVKVVLPASWFRRKPNVHDPNRSNAYMQTDDQDVLEELRKRGLLVASPPADDDDAYAIALARRESARTVQRCRDHHVGMGTEQSSLFPIASMGGAFVLSNDMFRDAQDRDPTLRAWLVAGTGQGSAATHETIGRQPPTSSLASSTSSGSSCCPGRISYTFADVGAMDDRGDPQLDFLPNPRHPLVQWIEERHRSHVR